MFTCVWVLLEQATLHVVYVWETELRKSVHFLLESNDYLTDYPIFFGNSCVHRPWSSKGRVLNHQPNDCAFYH